MLPQHLINGRHAQILLGSDEYDQAVMELIYLGWLKDIGIELNRHQYVLLKTRSTQ